MFHRPQEFELIQDSSQRELLRLHDQFTLQVFPQLILFSTKLRFLGLVWVGALNSLFGMVNNPTSLWKSFGWKLLKKSRLGNFGVIIICCHMNKWFIKSNISGKLYTVVSWDERSGVCAFCNDCVDFSVQPAERVQSSDLACTCIVETSSLCSFRIQKRIYATLFTYAVVSQSDNQT